MANDILDQLRKLKRERPFTPFQLLTAGGDRLAVESQFQFHAAESIVIYAYPQSNRTLQLKSAEIVRIEPLNGSLSHGRRDEILRWKRLKPFRAFGVMTADGRKFVIDNPDALALGESEMHFLPQSGTWIHLAYDQIAVVQASEERPAA